MVAKESRLVTEDQEDDGLEAYDDYNGRSILFGQKAVQEANHLLKLEKLELLYCLETNCRQQEMQDDDEQVRDWEMQQIHYGQRSNIDENNLMPTPKATSEIPSNSSTYLVPTIRTLIPIDEIVSSLDAAVLNLEISLKQYTLHQDISSQEAEDSERNLAGYSEQVGLASTRYDYFSGLNGYIEDLVDFLDAKVSD